MQFSKYTSVTNFMKSTSYPTKDISCKIIVNMSKGVVFTMKIIYTTIFKQYFRSCLLQTRSQLGLTQSQMAEKLNISDRAYSNLESGKYCCSTITLVLFLLLCTDNYNTFLEDLRKEFENVYKCVP